jgi:hypothetical protein
VKSKRGKNHQLSKLITYEKFYIPFQFVLFPALKIQKRQGPVPLIRPYLPIRLVELSGLRVAASPAALNTPATTWQPRAYRQP